MATAGATGAGETIERPEADDYDLLTYGEAAARLSEVIVEERSTLESLEQKSGDNAPDIAKSQQRLSLLIERQERLARTRANGEELRRVFSPAPGCAAKRP
jgi:hypothetical protein